jgi:hypothetical protein
MLEEELGKWKRFQDVLRIDDRELFEDMVDTCRRYASEAGNLASPSKAEPMILSILFAHHKRLFELNRLLQKNDTQ